MRRTPVVAAAVFAGAIPFHTESPEVECKDRKCSREMIATIPEQPHAPEEPPAYEIQEHMVEIPMSPSMMVPRGGEFHRQWLKDNAGDLQTLLPYFADVLKTE